MGQQPISNRIFAGAATFIGLGMAWIAIVNNIPSQQELSAKESSPPTLQAVPTQTVSEPVLDLSIPGVPSATTAPEVAQPTGAANGPSVARALDPRVAQVARLRCEAEVEQLCPEASSGPGQRQCLEKRAHLLPVPCQHQIRERLVRWKEERSRLTLACQADIRRFCPDVRPGSEHTVQCLQQHARDVSDGCYRMLPKGTLYFRQ